jgi:hypothetical protein
MNNSLQRGITMLFGDSSYINLSSYNVTHNPDGSLLLTPKTKAMKNDSYRTDSQDSQEQWRIDAEKTIKLAEYRLCNNWRSDSDPLKMHPPVYDELPSDQRLDAAVKQYMTDLENAWKS